MSGIKLYHASNMVIQEPAYDKSRIDTDFGQGFYVTPDLIMAEKWACRKSPSIINEYLLRMDDLAVYEFTDKREWLDFVVSNRQLNEMDAFYAKFDLLIGPTADDKLFSTIEQYEMGLLSGRSTARALDCMKIGVQYVCKTQQSIEALCFLQAHTMDDVRKAERKHMIRDDRAEAARLTQQIIREEIQKEDALLEDEMER